MPGLLLTFSKGGKKGGETFSIKFRIGTYNQRSGFLKSTIATHSTLLKWDV